MRLERQASRSAQLTKLCLAVLGLCLSALYFYFSACALLDVPSLRHHAYFDDKAIKRRTLVLLDFCAGLAVLLSTGEGQTPPPPPPAACLPAAPPREPAR